MRHKIKLTAFFLLLGVLMGTAQNTYRYSVDLNNIKDDKLQVTLLTPAVNGRTITFNLPKIVPGTYRYSDYGKFVSNFQAFNKAGKQLSVKQTSENTWEISKANTLYKITYDVEDTYDSGIPNNVYCMAGTNFEAGKNYVLNTFGIFGYLDNLKNIPFEFRVGKPDGFYGSTGLKAIASDRTYDLYDCKDADQLYDSPLMYCRPDTTTFVIGGASILVSVYAPKGLVKSAYIAQNLKKVIGAANTFLGGKLPVDKYAFIYYFNGENPRLKAPGALEHAYSSFYSLEEQAQETSIGPWIDMSAHEFFHIVTPLTIASREIREFDFNSPKLSKHLWLYEGSTEYDAHLVQVRSGMYTPQQYLQKLAEKITFSRTRFKDSLPFTELSTESAGKWKDQYSNVYLKGALISASLDLYLLKLSKGNYGLRNLKHDLGVRYGKENYFDDNELFDVISGLTYPEIRTFFSDYVEGKNPIPYERFFAFAGVTYTPAAPVKVATLGGVKLSQTGDDSIVVAGIENLNEFGKNIGYQVGDHIESINGIKVNVKSFPAIIQQFNSNIHAGDKVEVKLNRKNSDGIYQLVTVTKPAVEVDKVEFHKLSFDLNPTAEQIAIRTAWLGKTELPTAALKADPNDVSTVDQIVTAIYDVISGPAGERNWARFQSLFYPGAYMGGMAKTPKGIVFNKTTPLDYAKRNGALFKQYDFTEKELGRVISEFGNIAQVFTAYEFRLNAPTPVSERGINSLQLVKENGRWWIQSLTWEEESGSQRIPQKFLNK